MKMNLTIMRVEWVKARARMMRWKEEVLIVQEEMRRVLAYHRWKAAWWKDRNFFHSDPAIASGISGYAHKQAAICLQMAKQCAVYWLRHFKEKGIVASWASDYDYLLEVRDGPPSVPVEQISEDAILEVEEDEIDYDENGFDIEEDKEDEYDFDFND